MGCHEKAQHDMEMTQRILNEGVQLVQPIGKGTNTSMHHNIEQFNKQSQYIGLTHKRGQEDMKSCNESPAEDANQKHLHPQTKHQHQLNFNKA